MAIANKVAACGPIGVQTTLASAHLAIDSSEAIAFAQLGTQYSALYRTKDFIEGMAAQAEGRPPYFMVINQAVSITADKRFRTPNRHRASGCLASNHYRNQ
ncbi:hypothetical protein HAT93_02916 [Dickeya solani]|nr:hypothetical protein [Dickeya solani]